jgi:hypothetical protein
VRTGRTSLCAISYGHNGGSTLRLFSTIAAYHVGDEVQKIDTPILVTVNSGRRSKAALEASPPRHRAGR